jgi:hypothetical protein
MNKKKQAPSLHGDIHLNKIPYKLNQLPYKPTITLAVDKLTQGIIGFSIQEIRVAKNFQIHSPQLKITSKNYVRNAMARKFAGNPGDLIIDNSPEAINASNVKAMKKFALQPKLAWDSTVVQTAQIERILADVFLTLSLRLRGQPRPSPKNPPFGELWRQHGHRFPRS